MRIQHRQKNELCDYFSHARDLEGEAEKANGDAEGFRIRTLEKSYRKVTG